MEAQQNVEADLSPLIHVDIILLYVQFFVTVSFQLTVFRNPVSRIKLLKAIKKLTVCMQTEHSGALLTFVR